MQLRNVCVVGHEGELVDITIAGGSIRACTVAGMSDDDSPFLSFGSALAFPGLINSHDHLDFNLFRRMGSGGYQSYRDWGNDIQQNRQQDIEQVLRIPKALRLQWGIYKNLLAGVTTVVNHGEHITAQHPLIDIHQHYHCIHSVGFDKKWKWKLNRPRPGKLPFVLHAGEGTDRSSRQEIDQLIRWNWFNKDLVAVHGIAMQPAQANHFKALVWCADSNFFLFNTTAAVEQLKFHVPVIFGTDSTLTASWDLWEQLHIAAATSKLSHTELFDSLTSTPAAVWGMKDKGRLEPGFRADIVVAEKTGRDFTGLQSADILLVMKDGRILLFDEKLAEQLVGTGTVLADYSSFKIGGRTKRCLGDLPSLVRQIRSYYPDAVLPVEI